MYFGQYQHQLDDKDRFRVPAKLKAKLGEKIYLTAGSGGCLFVFSEDDYAELRAKLKAVPLLSNPAAQAPLRALFSGGDDPECDNQGRYKLADHLKAFAGIDKDIVFVGAGPRVEIWSAEGWKKYNEQVTGCSGGFDGILEELGKYGL